MPKYTAHITERRTGKTSLAVQYTKTLDNAMLVVFNNHMARYIMENHNLPERKIFVLQHKHHVHHLKYFRTIIFDEPSFIKGEWQEEVLEDLLRANCNIIAFGSLTASGSNYILNKVKELQVKQEYKMSNNTKIELPVGYEFTGEYREPNKGEYIIDRGLYITKILTTSCNDLYHIIRKVRPRADKGSSFYFIDVQGNINNELDLRLKFCNIMYSKGNYFLTREEAETKLEKIKEIIREDY